MAPQPPHNPDAPSQCASIRLLGAFAATGADGTDLDLPKKTQALLAFLMVNRGRPFPRDDLAILLWSNAGPEQARQSLRQCLSSLRRTLPATAGFLLTQDDALTLADTGALANDIDELGQLEKSNSITRLSAAARLFRGEFLAGLNLQREPFDDWVTSERRVYADVRMRILTNLARLQGQARDHAAAIETARQLTTLDPLCEQSSRLLMELLAASGQRGLALVEHARIERLLRKELQVAPDTETSGLVERIKQRPSPRGRGSRAGPPLNNITYGTFEPHQSLEDRPTITIVPFTNISGDAKQEHFVEGLTDEVTSALVREKWPLVIMTSGRSTVATATQGQVNSRYIVSGSARCEAGKARVVVQLTDARLGRMVWSDRLEADANSQFALHDRLCMQIVSRLAAAVSKAEITRVARKPAELLTGYELYLRASDLCRRGPEENRTALRQLRRAIELNPEYAPAYALSARCLHLRRLMGWSHPKDHDLRHAIGLAHRALQIDDTDPEVLWMSGLAIANVDGNLRDGKFLVERSLAINPNNASAWIGSSFVHANLGEPDVAVADFERAQQINPEDSSQHLQWHAAATAYFIAGRHEEADLAADRALAQRRMYPGTLRLKIATSGLLGRLDAAHDAARRLAVVNPDTTMAYVRKYWELWPDTRDAVAAMLDGWRRAGMAQG